LRTLPFGQVFFLQLAASHPKLWPSITSSPKAFNPKPAIIVLLSRCCVLSFNCFPE
jgi:hypothetical protein